MHSFGASSQSIAATMISYACDATGTTKIKLPLMGNEASSILRIG
jgi:hypothetical protein